MWAQRINSPQSRHALCIGGAPCGRWRSMQQHTSAEMMDDYWRHCPSNAATRPASGLQRIAMPVPAKHMSVDTKPNVSMHRKPYSSLSISECHNMQQTLFIAVNKYNISCYFQCNCKNKRKLWMYIYAVAHNLVQKQPMPLDRNELIVTLFTPGFIRIRFNLIEKK